jgi:hypothetical protein
MTAPLWVTVGGLVATAVLFALLIYVESRRPPK